jgi:hypothetical protein
MQLRTTKLMAKDVLTTCLVMTDDPVFQKALDMIWTTADTAAEKLEDEKLQNGGLLRDPNAVNISNPLDTDGAS